MITFVVHVTVRPPNQCAFEALMKHVRDITRANEPGVVHYDFGKSAGRSDTYIIIEVYQDSVAHAAHMATPWVIESIPTSRSLIEGAFDIQQYVSLGTKPIEQLMKD